jgi:hypothetical protein
MALGLDPAEAAHLLPAVAIGKGGDVVDHLAAAVSNIDLPAIAHLPASEVGRPGGEE